MQERVSVTLERDEWNTIALGLKDLADNLETGVLRVDGTLEDRNDLVATNRNLAEMIQKQADV